MSSVVKKYTKFFESFSSSSSSISETPPPHRRKQIPSCSSSRCVATPTTPALKTQLPPPVTSKPPDPKVEIEQLRSAGHVTRLISRFSNAQSDEGSSKGCYPSTAHSRRRPAELQQQQQQTPQPQIYHSPLVSATGEQTTQPSTPEQDEIDGTRPAATTSSPSSASALAVPLTDEISPTTAEQPTVHFESRRTSAEVGSIDLSRLMKVQHDGPELETLASATDCEQRSSRSSLQKKKGARFLSKISPMLLSGMWNSVSEVPLLEDDDDLFHTNKEPVPVKLVYSLPAQENKEPEQSPNNTMHRTFPCEYGYKTGILKSGYLYKRNNFTHLWEHRYFTLHLDGIMVFKNEKLRKRVSFIKFERGDFVEDHPTFTKRRALCFSLTRAGSSVGTSGLKSARSSDRGRRQAYYFFTLNKTQYVDWVHSIIDVLSYREKADTCMI